ncbi:Kinesin-like protein KIF15-A [Merluccius polli]|uniref:Kinesin-like protein KIF15-A n=1 Tax=Merluccius polli TaxID=89951 RepID=A0AA47MNL3_MERPO|nr:Kinesin-like protein KIF15-A [Merluccius polli]
MRARCAPAAHGQQVSVAALWAQRTRRKTRRRRYLSRRYRARQITSLERTGDSDSIKVFVRVRPLTQDTGLTTDGDQNLCLTVTSPNTIRLHSKPEPRTFTYDHVADVDVSQDAVFASVAKNIVESCMNGYNGTIFAYGQTGSGKTFTMLGPSDFDNFTDENRGVIPRSFEYLFFLINREVERSGKSKSFLCKCSFIEIYNELIYDLLDSASASLFLRENIKKGVFVEGAVEKFVTSAAEAYQVLSMGWRNRRVASTSMNRESSRSHAVFTMALESKETVNEVVNIRTSQLNLVDLAGSERQKDTHTEGSRLKVKYTNVITLLLLYLAVGMVILTVVFLLVFLQEASSINRSLMCLGQVIMALVDVSNGKNRHICYRDSKLTFLLRDSLGGNAKTYIIANVHPGSKCFGETLSTLHFAQRAKLIKNKAMINEDTQGNVRQLQAEVKKLKEQLAQVLASPTSVMLSGRDVAPWGPQLSSSPQNDHLEVSYKAKFLQAIGLWKKREEEKTLLLQKVAQLEEAWAHKEKFIHSSRMIVKFREDHISRLEKKLKGGQFSLSDKESEVLVNQLKEEINILNDQINHHPKMTRYAAENYSLREENRHLRSLESIRKAEEAAGQAAVELEEAFQLALEAPKPTEAQPAFSTPVTAENVSAISVERQKAQLLQKQSELTATIQAFEEYKEVTKKQMLELESEKRYLDKSNRHLENILEATNAYKKQEVSQLNRIHVETIKILTTPTKAYNLRPRHVALASPEHLNGEEGGMDDICNEQPPPEMAELACEALTEELQQVQEQSDRVQTQLDKEEMKSSKLLQQVAKLEEQVAVMSQESSRKDKLLSAERSSRSMEQLALQESINSLQQTLESEQRTGVVLQTEIRDLRLVLQSSDKELAAVKSELRDGQGEQQKEMSQLSSNLISTQLQLDKVQLEWEQLLEQHTCLQDSFDQLQAETKFEADQARQQLQDSQQDATSLRAHITELDNCLQMERNHTSTLTSQLRENNESTSKELIETMEQNTQLKKQVSDLMTQQQQQVSNHANLEHNLASAKETVNVLEQKIEQDKSVVLDLMNQTRVLRSELSEKEENLAHLSGDIKDITAKYNAVTSEREEVREQNSRMQTQLHELKEEVGKKVASNQIEVELLQDEVVYATEEVERLTKVLDEQNGLLQSFQEQTTQKDAMIQSLQQQLKKQEEAVEKVTLKVGFNPLLEGTVTPKSSPRTHFTPRSSNTDLTQVLERQELESCRSSMITMEILLAEHNSERSAKNSEIQRLKTQLNEIQALLDEFYGKQNHLEQNGNTNGELMNDAIKQSMLRELQEERAEKSTATQKLSEALKRLQAQESMLAQSQTCVQELTSELRNRCLELRELSLKDQEQEKLLNEVEVLRKQVDLLSEENGKLVGHKNHKQKIEYVVKLKKDNAKLQEDNEKLRSEMTLLRNGV